MITSKISQRVKDFYNKNPFPGPYTSTSVKNYSVNNRYISFISESIVGCDTVLDAGCGTGFITNFLAQEHPSSRFRGVDFSDSVDHAIRIRDELGISNAEFVKQNISTLSTDDKFDAVICQGVLHHIPNYQETLEHLKSMVRPNGIFLIGLYHPWGKALQKILPKNYTSTALEIDQEEHPFELSFWARDVIKMFPGYTLIDSRPGKVLFNWRNGGLTTYLFRKGGQKNDQLD